MTKINRLGVHIPLASGVPDADQTITVFHRWIREGAIPEELLIDVVDYRHVPDGPGVLLVAEQAIYSLSSSGLQVDSRREVRGEPIAEVTRSIQRALIRARALAAAPEFRLPLTFSTSQLSVSIRDRLVAPTTAELIGWVQAGIEPIIDGVGSEATVSVTAAAADTDPGGPLAVDVRY